MAFDDLKHAQKERLKYLDRVLFWDGTATRSTLMEKFGVSNPQAALDFKAYLRTSGPDAITYDRSSKRYVTTDSFKRLCGEASTDEVASLLQANGFQFFDALPDLQRVQNVRVFRPLYQALKRNLAIKICYQSMRSLEPENRWIIPQRFASDGVRLHLRAWCCARSGFRDFVPARIDPDRSFETKAIESEVPKDTDWHTWSILTLKPHHSFSDFQKKVIRTEFGFVSDTLEVRVRKALEFYTKRRWGLDQDNPRLEVVACRHEPMKEEVLDED